MNRKEIRENADLIVASSAAAAGTHIARIRCTP
jgi:hypothetical protein